MRAAALLLILAACGSDRGGGGADAAPSGRACFTGLDAGAPAALASPALECAGRVCLHQQGAARDLCTAFCDDATDCVASPGSACTRAFTCIAPVDVGPFAGRKVCVC
jgi:hypothetical protein